MISRRDWRLCCRETAGGRCGERAREHVRSTFELGTAIDRHLAIYNELLAGESSPAGSVH